MSTLLILLSLGQDITILRSQDITAHGAALRSNYAILRLESPLMSLMCRYLSVPPMLVLCCVDIMCNSKYIYLCSSRHLQITETEQESVVEL
jgi:hypothetical protein